MIFTEQTAPETTKQKRLKKQWVELGVKYLEQKKKNPSLTMKQFANENGLNYETTKRSFNKLKDRIQHMHKLQNPNKTKEQWIELGVLYLMAKAKGDTIRTFADEYGLNYETAKRAFNKYKKEIEETKGLADAMQTKKRLTDKQRLELLKRDFRAQVKERIKGGTPRNERKSQEWFRDTMKRGIRGHQVHKPKVGRVYAFVYDAKHKNTLPYWDQYPLIVYLGNSRKFKNYLLGLNLHYIPVKAREEFLVELLKYSTTDRISNRTRLDVNWNKVKSMRGSKLMIKMYIPNHIKGTFIEVKPSDWVNVVTLPTQKFVSGPDNKAFSSQKVWKKY